MVSSPQKKLYIVKQSEKSDATIVDSAIRAKITNIAVGTDRSLNPGFYFDFSRAVPSGSRFNMSDAGSRSSFQRAALGS